MKALTLHQPWASLVALGVKTIETRSWATKYRGPLAIHSAKTTECDGWRVGEWTALLLYPETPEIRRLGSVKNGELVADRYESRLASPAPLGAVVATCTLVDVVPITDDGQDALEVYPRVESSLGGGDFPDGWLDLWHPTLGSAIDPEGTGRSIPDEAPYGDYSPGRFAWLLADITPMEPVPAKGKQGLWEWDP